MSRWFQNPQQIPKSTDATLLARHQDTHTHMLYALNHLLSTQKVHYNVNAVQIGVALYCLLNNKKTIFDPTLVELKMRLQTVSNVPGLRRVVEQYSTILKLHFGEGTPVTPSPREQRQEDHGFKASLGYTVKPHSENQGQRTQLSGIVLASHARGLGFSFQNRKIKSYQ